MWCEYMADQFAVDKTSKEDMIKTLSLALQKEKSFVKIDFFNIHPSLKSRINHIRRFKK